MTKPTTQPQRQERPQAVVGGLSSNPVRPLALVTGGTRGIGRATAFTMAEQGWDLVLSFVHDADSARETELGCVERGAAVRTVQADVSVEQDVLRLFTTVDEVGPLGALINNAGIVGARTRVDALTVERIQRMFAVNVFGTILCSREAVKRMSTLHGGSGGRIVNVSSAAARLGSPGEYVDYAAAKGAIDSFTVGLAKEVAEEGILVNAIRPGLVDTEIHASGGQPDRAERLRPLIPLQRIGTAPEMAGVIAFLCSDAASYLCGALIDVSGGR